MDAKITPKGEAGRLSRESAIFARFSSDALRADNLDALLCEACRLVSEAIDVQLVKVLELQKGKNEMLVRAGVNWKEGVVGHATFGANPVQSPSGYALHTNKPVVSMDVAAEDRFDIPALLSEHGVRSMVNVLVPGAEGNWGVLEVDSRRPREFDHDDLDFLQNYANVLSAAIERMQLHAQLQDKVRQNEILAGELQHRIKNLLTNVQAIAHRTRMLSKDLDEFADAFDHRLALLARAQDRLVRGHEIGMRELVEQELMAHGIENSERVRLSGGNVPLPPETAQALGFALHELATNATKYGAFAHENARLEIFWSMGEAAWIRWRETGVPLGQVPQHQGYGSETISRTVPCMLDGTSELTFHSDGVEWLLSFASGRGDPGEAGS